MREKGPEFRRGPEGVWEGQRRPECWGDLKGPVSRGRPEWVRVLGRARVGQSSGEGHGEQVAAKDPGTEFWQGPGGPKFWREQGG